MTADTLKQIDREHIGLCMIKHIIIHHKTWSQHFDPLL